MKAIVLCASYATRLYPITKNFPKPLLKIAGKEIITYLVDQLNKTGLIDHIYVVVNSKFHKFFKIWVNSVDSNVPITIYDDMTSSNDDRLGAIGDLNFALNKGQINDDIIVLPGDNLYQFDIKELIDFFYEKKSAVIAAHDMKDIEKLSKKFSSVDFDKNGRVNYFEEKPENPKTSMTCPAFYIFPKNFSSKIIDYLAEGNNPDAPGYLIKWLYKKEEVYAFLVKEGRYDIGNIESYNKTNKIFEEKSRNTK